VVDPAGVDHEIEILVLSCLPSDQRIDAPPPIHPHDNLRRREEVEDLQHLIGPHVDILPALDVPSGVTLPAVGDGWSRCPGRISVANGAPG
jgi:hypothetical protein